MDDYLTGAICEPINECLEQPDICHDGRCLDTEDGYSCDCYHGYGGPTCAERREQPTAFVSTSALLIILLCIVLLLSMDY